jgi:hypothetical protein
LPSDRPDYASWGTCPADRRWRQAADRTADRGSRRSSEARDGGAGLPASSCVGGRRVCQQGVVPPARRTQRRPRLNGRGCVIAGSTRSTGNRCLVGLPRHACADPPALGRPDALRNDACRSRLNGSGVRPAPDRSHVEPVSSCRSAGVRASGKPRETSTL